MFELPGLEDVKEVVVDEDVIEGRKTPVYVYAKAKGEEDAKAS
jgi:ATP-dependent Clp protease ATP-binding subunit ClpX